jgi:cytochrome c553
MNKLLTTMFALAVACVTVSAQAQQKAGNAEAGAKKTSLCMGCHGIIDYQATFPQIHKVPMIAGQTASYIASALDQYRSGDRKHPTMRAIAASLSDQDIADLAAFYSQLGVEKGAAPLPATAAAPSAAVEALISRDKDNACTKCHGANFSTPNDGSVPKLAGQHESYLAVALRSYKLQNHPLLGRTNPVMGAQAKRYTDPEVKELAGYISSLPSEVKTVPEPRFHEASR